MDGHLHRRGSRRFRRRLAASAHRQLPRAAAPAAQPGPADHSFSARLHVRRQGRVVVPIDRSRLPVRSDRRRRRDPKASRSEFDHSRDPAAERIQRPGRGDRIARPRRRIAERIRSGRFEKRRRARCTSQTHARRLHATGPAAGGVPPADLSPRSARHQLENSQPALCPDQWAGFSRGNQGRPLRESRWPPVDYGPGNIHYRDEPLQFRGAGGASPEPVRRRAAGDSDHAHLRPNPHGAERTAHAARHPHGRGDQRHRLPSAVSADLARLARRRRVSAPPGHHGADHRTVRAGSSERLGHGDRPERRDGRQRRRLRHLRLHRRPNGNRSQRQHAPHSPADSDQPPDNPRRLRRVCLFRSSRVSAIGISHQRFADPVPPGRAVRSSKDAQARRPDHWSGQRNVAGAMGQNHVAGRDRRRDSGRRRDIHFPKNQIRFGHHPSGRRQPGGETSRERFPEELGTVRRAAGAFGGHGPDEGRRRAGQRRDL